MSDYRGLNMGGVMKMGTSFERTDALNFLTLTESIPSFFH